ncbi:MAG: hypothetical protein Q9191_000636 [Dirinaria sp. TL-2023a]
MAWQPDEETLRQLAGYLRDALSARDNDAQKRATLMLTQAKPSPDFSSYLTHIFVAGHQLQKLDIKSDELVLIRTSAGLNLKNCVRSSYKSMTGAARSYIQVSALTCLQDPSVSIRNVAGSVVTEVVQRGGILGWPTLLPELLSLASNDNGRTSAAAQEGASNALLKVCEDNKKVLGKEYQGQQPLDFIFPRLLGMMSSQLPGVRASAIASLNYFIPEKSPTIMMSLEKLLAHLFQLANDASSNVRKNVCHSFVQLVDVIPEKLQPHMEGLVDYMLLQQQRNAEDPELALEAAEFWLCVGENNHMCHTLGPYLHKIVPVLLESMVYDEEDIIRLEGDPDDANQEDRAEDLKPQFAKAKNLRAATNGQHADPEVNSSESSKPKAMVPEDDDDDLSEGEIDEYDDGADVEENWNLRKCSAATLDVLASNFHQPVFAMTLPYLKDNLPHHDWPYREAAVLAIGAVADGCMEAVTPHLPELIPYLISLLSDEEAVVRVITCWSLGRYSYWASHLQDSDEKKRYFEPMIEGILNRMLDKNKRVQQSAVSAFASLEEKAASELTPYCAPIIHRFVQCFQRYKDRNMLVLYDCVQTLAEHVGPALARPETINFLMPAIIERWNKVSDQAQELFPMLECLSYVATALGGFFDPFAVPVFNRCISIIHQNLEAYVLAAKYEGMDKPNKDFLVTSLDLLSAVIQALDARRSKELVTSSQPNFFELLMFCMEDPSNDVRQSSYALLGDCAVKVFAELQPFLESVFPMLIKQLDLDSVQDEDIDTGFGVINNACWSCGEIAMKEVAGMAPHVEQLYYRFMAIITNPEIPISVHENAAIALGRLGVGCSDALAPRLGEFAQPFLRITRPIDDTDEKGGAILGFNLTVEKNPRAMETCLLDYFKACAAGSKAKVDQHIIEESFRRVSR